MTSQKLRLLALHSFRTSGHIFAEQMRRAGLDKALSDLVEVVYIDAPNLATGPIPADVLPHLQGPYYEWWSAEKDEERGTWTYDGWEKGLSYVTDYVRLHGPFDGLMGFSQGGALTAVVTAMQQAGVILQGVPRFKCCLIFMGVVSREAKHAKAFKDKVACPSMHIIGEKDYVRKASLKLTEYFVNPVVIMHPRGHSIPALDGVKLATLRGFLEARISTSSL